MRMPRMRGGRGGRTRSRLGVLIAAGVLGGSGLARPEALAAEECPSGLYFSMFYTTAESCTLGPLTFSGFDYFKSFWGRETVRQHDLVISPELGGVWSLYVETLVRPGGWYGFRFRDIGLGYGIVGHEGELTVFGVRGILQYGVAGQIDLVSGLLATPRYSPGWGSGGETFATYEAGCFGQTYNPDVTTGPQRFVPPCDRGGTEVAFWSVIDGSESVEGSAFMGGEWEVLYHVVPEPRTWMLVASGLLVFLIDRRRRACGPRRYI